MGDPTRDVRPGRLAFRLNERRYIIECHHVPDHLAVAYFCSDPNDQRACARRSDQPHLRLASSLRMLHRSLNQVGHFGNNRGEGRTARRVEVQAQQLGRRAVRQVDGRIGVQPYDACRYAAQHCFREPSSLVEVAIRQQQARLLALQLAGHAIEGAAEHREFADRRHRLHTHGHIPVPHPLRSRDQAADRSRDMCSKRESHPHSGQQEQQGNDDKDHNESDKNPLPALFQPPVLGDSHFRALNLLEDGGIKEASDHEVGVNKPIELYRSPHAVFALRRQHDDLAAIGLLDNLPGHQIEFQRQAQRRPGDNPAVAVNHHRFRQRAKRSLNAQQLVEGGRVPHQGRSVAVEVVRHGKRLGADALTMFAEIGLRHGAGRLDGRTHPLAEPCLDSKVQEERGKHGHKDRRGYCNQTEQNDDSNVEAGTGKSPTSLCPDADKLANDDRPQQQQEHRVDVEQDQNGVRIGAELGRARPGNDGHDAGDDRS